METKHLSILFNIILILSFILMASVHQCNAQASTERLDSKQESMVKITALTAIGNLEGLHEALNSGLDAGLSINEIKEAMVHLYAYCGFPRSIRGLQTFMEVLEARKAKGINDHQGKEASSIKNEEDKYERGKKILTELTGEPQGNAPTGYGAFAPAIDKFLKEHLFADIFERDVLNYAQRELVTISVLSSIGGVEPMLRSHFSICLNLGITPPQLTHFISVISSAVGKEKADVARIVLDEVLKNNLKK